MIQTPLAATALRSSAGLDLVYTIVDSAFGRLLVAGTPVGVSAVALSDDDGPLIAAVREDYPEAQIRSDPKAVADWAEALVALLAGDTARFEFPLQVLGTPFQCRVWDELRAIPRGTTRTYQQVAEAIGRPTAARAVGRACATNRVSVLIPCHRMVRTDGNLAGYRWGLARKQGLQELERRNVRVDARGL